MARLLNHWLQNYKPNFGKIDNNWLAQHGVFINDYQILMKTQIEKGHIVRIFIYNGYLDCSFKSEIYEFASELIIENGYYPTDYKTIHSMLQLMFANTKNNDAINDAQQVISDDIFDSFYNKLFNLFLKSYGSLDNWEQGFLIVELQVLDSNGSVVCQTEGFVNYNTFEG